MAMNSVPAFGAVLLGLLGCVCAQSIPRDQIDYDLDQGEVQKAETLLRASLAHPENLSDQDSVYLLKNLGVLEASNPKTQKNADKLFYRLLELDPFASLYDTYASNPILGRFQKIRRDFQQEKGGKALIPPVVVFDFEGTGFSPEDLASLTNQFVGEMQKLLIFHTLDRPMVVETLRRLHKQPADCADRACRIDIARRLLAEYLVLPQISRIDSVYTFQLELVSVATGENSTVLRKVYTGPLAQVLAKGLPDLANALQDAEAAWLNLSVQPSNTQLTLDGTPLAASDSRLPVNPGKHRVCGSSPGYTTLCRDFEVRKADAVTYSLALQPSGGKVPEQPATGKVRENWDDNPQVLAPEDADGHSKGPSTKTVVWIVAGMAVAVGGLALLLSVK